MPSAIDQGQTTRTLNWMMGLPTTAPTKPIKYRLVTTMGTGSTNGTEVVNAGGSTYAPQDFIPASGTAITPATATNGSITNSNGVITFANMPDTSGVTGVKGGELWDSAATPLREMVGTLSTTRTTALGDSLVFAASTITASLSYVMA